MKFLITILGVILIIAGFFGSFWFVLVTIRSNNLDASIAATHNMILWMSLMSIGILLIIWGAKKK